jgi:hypothetical protein
MIFKDAKLRIYGLKTKFMSVERNVIKIIKQWHHATTAPSSQIYSCENLLLSCFEACLINDDAGPLQVTIWK